MSRFLYDKDRRFEVHGRGDVPPDEPSLPFDDPATAHDFIHPFSTDPLQVDTLREALSDETSFPTVHRMRPHEMLDQIAWRLRSGYLTIAPKKITTRGIAAPGVVTPPASPAEPAAEPTQEPTQPPPEVTEPEPVVTQECILTAVTYTCSHKPPHKLEVQAGAAKTMPVMEVVAGDKGNGDIITIAPTMSAPLCDEHKQNHVRVRGPAVSVVKPDGHLTQEVFYTKINHLYLLRYFWPWSLKPDPFTFHPLACEGDGAAAKILVYPDIEVTAKIELMLNTDARVDAKMEKAQERGYVEKRGRPAHTEWKLAVGGKVKYGNHASELSLALENKIKQWASFNRLIKRSIDLFTDYFYEYTGVTLRPKFPNLKVNYKGQYKEIENTLKVGTAWNVHLKADPLLGLEVRIEILDVMIKALKKIPQVAAIATGLEKIRDYAKREGQTFEIYLGFTGLIAGEMGIEKKEQLDSANASGKVEGVVKAEFKAKAAFGSKGRISFSAGAEAGAHTGMSVSVNLDHDAKGVFLKGKLMLLKCKFEYAAWASARFYWEIKESYEGEYIWWEDKDLLKTKDLYIVSS